jgi:Zn-dependent protease
MFRSWKIGTAFGIGLYVHWTFLLLPAWVLLSNAATGGPFLAVFLVALVVAAFGCVLLHELGHALMARRFGIGTRDITLYPIGGVARLERMSEQPREELWIALAGPAVNVAIAAVLAGVMVLLGFGRLALPGAGGPVFSLAGTFLSSLLVTNLLLVGFNLLPAFPMDGGRVLRALLALRMDRLRATEVAVKVGLVLAVLLGLAAFPLHAPMLPLIALFVFFAGQAELAALRRAAAYRAELLDVLPADSAVDLPPASGQVRYAGMQGPDGVQVWVVWRSDRPAATYWSSCE